MALTDDLVAYYKLDGSDFGDAHGSYDLTNSGTANDSSGIINDARDFSSGDYMDVDGVPTGYARNQSFTINLWIKGTQTDYPHFFYRCQSSSEYGVRWYFNASSGLTYWNRKSGAHALRYGNITGYNDGDWHMVTFTYNGSACGGYVDGVADGGTSYTASNATDTVQTTATYGINARTSGNAFVGSMDEIGIWDRVLTSDEVTELYNSGSGLQYPFAAAAGEDNSIFHGTNQ